MPEPEELEKVTLRLSRAEMAKFRQRHPGHGDVTWFFRTALEKYNKLQEVDLDELVTLAVAEINPRST